MSGTSRLEAGTPAGAAGAMMLGYAGGSYLLFLVALLWAVGFFAGVPWVRNIDTGATGSAGVAVVIDLLLLGVFAVQHSVMARPAFKRRWTRVVPAAAERSSFVLASSLVLLGMFALWHALPAVIWDIQGPARVVVFALYGVGLALVVASIFAISHSDFLGLRQAWLFSRGQQYRPVPFVAKGLYAIVRHPLMTGFFIFFWATPHLTVGHLLFAAAATAYILVAVRFEEHDLVASLGSVYTAYRQAVPAYFPRVPGRR